ncbi:unnamed protein product, partial [Discosporangium mesarthrocarpum]
AEEILHFLSLGYSPVPEGYRLMNVILLLIVVNLVGVGGLKSKSLYPKGGFVHEFDEVTLKEARESGELWVVECYAPWCTHCQRFKPTWEMVAETLRESSIHVGAINCEQQKKLCAELGVRSFPRVKGINSPSAHGEIVTVVNGATTFSIVMKKISTAFPGIEFDLVERNVEDDQDVRPSHGALRGHLTKEKVQEPTCSLRLADAMESMHFALSTAVFTEGPVLSTQRLDATVSFIRLVGQTLPTSRKQNCILQLADELETDSKLNNMERWSKRVNGWPCGGSTPHVAMWPGVNLEKGSDPGTERFTAGLWTLFHTLSLSRATQRPSAQAVMEGIRAFVDEFFMCEVCRTHFLDMYDRCDNGRCAIPGSEGLRGWSGDSNPSKDPGHGPPRED